jgi:hypothetical protein
MQEKEFTMNDAFQVWWFIGWRTGLTLIAVNLLMRFIPAEGAVSEAIGAVGIIISVLVAVYYTKLAVNRNYKSFRLLSVAR